MGVSELNTPSVISIFGSSRPRPGEPEYALAYDLGRELGEAGFAVCNGGYGGIMEASARGAKEARPPGPAFAPRTIGVVYSALPGRSANPWIEQVVTVETLVERLVKLISLADGYVILKGGTGTLLEFAAVWEFTNKNLMMLKPLVVVGTFWDGLIRTLKEELAWEGLEDCTRYVHVVSTPHDCVQLLRERLPKR